MSRTHQPCSDCGSSDALIINDDGSTKCFSCGTYTKADKYRENTQLEPQFLKGVVRDIVDRCLNTEVCQRYSYRISQYKGRPVQIATYRDFKGKPIFQKIRFSDKKEFFIIGKFKPLLYGMNLFSGQNKKLIITEGEIDCLSVSQVIGNFPVVSIPNGADNAQEAVKYNLDFIEQFEEVVFMFDNDEHGIKAAEECAGLLTIGKAKIVNLPMKDANEMLKAGKIQELYKATWNGREYRPDGIVCGNELWKLIDKPIEKGLSYPFPTVTDLTYGIRPAELIVFGAGTGMGKTEFFKEIETHLAVTEKQTIGVIHLEEQTRESVLGIMGKHASKKFHIPTEQFSEEEKKTAFNETVGTGRIYFYDGFGTTEFQKIKTTIRYMVKAKGCKFIFFDHITALGDCLSDGGEVNQYMRKVVSELANLTRELNFTLFAISHLRKTDGKTGKTHEEGGRVRLDDLYGAAAIKQWASYVIGLERNQQAENIEERHTTTLRFLKDRYTGQATGHTVKIKFNTETGRLLETGETDCSEFEDEDEDISNF